MDLYDHSPDKDGELELDELSRYNLPRMMELQRAAPTFREHPLRFFPKPT